MNALELAEIQAFKTEELTMWERNHTASMLRKQQAEIEALKEKVKQNADLNEKVYLCKKKLKPIVWMAEVEGGTMYTNYEYPESIPLYTHPVKELTDEEIYEIWTESLKEEAIVNAGKPPILKYQPFVFFAKAILRKAQEK